MKENNTPGEYWINLMIDFLTGKTTAEEQTLLLNWIDQSAENRLYYNQLREVWVSSGLGDPDTCFHKEKAFFLFKERVAAVKRSKQQKRKKLLIRMATTAAVLLPFILLLYVGRLYMNLKDSLADVQPVYTSVVAPKGSISQVELPDGTQVWLNAGSSVRYANTFGQKERNLTLLGEAYFDVTKDETLPFVVHSGELKIKVLGTRFNVKAYEQFENIKIALIEGSVSLQNTTEEQTYLLKPMETAIYNRKQNKIEIQKDLSLQANEWTSGGIIFNGERFEEIAFILEQRFNVLIHIEKEALKERRFKGDFTKNETIDRIFNVMATDGQFNYRISENRITVF